MPGSHHVAQARPREGTEMNSSKRVVVAILFVAILLFAGTLFWPLILNDMIKPVALVVWLLLRIFVLSIDQVYFWGAIIFMVAIFLYKLLSQEQTIVPSNEFIRENETINTIEYWYSLFILAENNHYDDKALKRALAHLLVSLYASKQHTTTNFVIYDALQRGEIPLPEPLHAFLFTEEPDGSKRSMKKFFQSIRKAPQKWIRRWTGQEKAEYYRMIDQVFCFMETSLEIKNDE
jgi:hypothetical protein